MQLFEFRHWHSLGARLTIGLQGVFLIAGGSVWVDSANATERVSYSLPELIARARTESPLLAVSRSEELGARAGIQTARAYPNPELQVGIGQAAGRLGGPSGFAPVLGVNQVLETPWLRAARLQVAQARVDLSASQVELTQAQVIAEAKRRFHELVRLIEEKQAFEEDFRLAEQIRQRVEVRASTGEAPRFDLIRAETEVAVVRKNLDTANLRVRQATVNLRAAVSPTLESDFSVRVDPSDRGFVEDAEIERLRTRLLMQSPDVALAEREIQRAQRLVEFEQSLVQPQVSLQASHDRSPSGDITRIGAQIQVPIFNRREGPIAEARAQLERARALLEQRRFETLSGFDAALEEYRVAALQTRALEGGIVDRSRSVIQIAEAAYRFGERGILEFLDAQRQFRLVRNELIQARFAVRLAKVELERFAGQ